jgi:hypothetical protein
VDGWVGAVTVLAFLAGLAILGNRLRRRQFLMIAEFRGLTALLIWEDNGTRYGQIQRAIQRARESQGL